MAPGEGSGDCWWCMGEAKVEAGGGPTEGGPLGGTPEGVVEGEGVGGIGVVAEEEELEVGVMPAVWETAGDEEEVVVMAGDELEPAGVGVEGVDGTLVVEVSFESSKFLQRNNVVRLV